MNNKANFNTFTFHNSNSQFISGLTLKKTPDAALELEVTGTFERIPKSWKPIPATISYNDSQIIVQFERPINYYHFRIDILGSVTSDYLANCQFVPTPIKATADILDKPTVTQISPPGTLPVESKTIGLACAILPALVFLMLLLLLLSCHFARVNRAHLIPMP